MDKKRLLGAVFAIGIGGKRPDIHSLRERLGADEAELRRELLGLGEEGYVKAAGSRYALTLKGRKEIRVVFIGGGFEVIHHGHVYTIERAKALGDVLVVSVARDSTIRRRKHREPVAGENERARMISSLRQVDAAILGVEGDIYETLEKVKPDVVALGYDQHHMESEIETEAKKRGFEVEVVRLDSPFPDVKTSALLKDF
jgi:FAD synthetase